MVRSGPARGERRDARPAIWRSPDPARGRRHGRPPVSRGGARPCARGSRRAGRAHDRRPRAQIRRRLPGPGTARCSLGDAARRLTCRQGHGRGPTLARRSGGLADPRPGAAGRDHRLRRLPDRSADRRGLDPRRADPAARTERRDGQGEPFRRQSCRPDRDGLPGARQGAGDAQGPVELHRQPRAPRRDRGIPDRDAAADAGRPGQPARHRWLSGRPGDVRCGAGRDRAA